jgi:uncharacterized OB-fold protein
MEPKITVKEYLGALRENKLIGLQCTQCGFITAPPRLSCRKCGCQDNQITTLSGKGKIATFTSVYVSVENRHGKTPYLVVMVALDEGPWIMGNLINTDPSQATFELIGKRVIMNNTLIFGEKPQGEPIAPQFVLEE